MSNPLFQTIQARVTPDGTILRTHADLLAYSLKSAGIDVSGATPEALASSAKALKDAFAAWPDDSTATPAAEEKPKTPRRRRTRAEIEAAKAAEGASPPAATPAAPPTPPAPPAPAAVPAPLPPAPPLPPGSVAGIPTVPQDTAL